MGVAIFAVLAGAVTAVLFVGQEGALQSGEQIRAVYLSSKALTAARSMRDASFVQLTAGQHGTCIGATGLWEFCGQQNVTADGFTTTLTILSLSESHVRMTAETRWREGDSRSGSVLLAEELTDWRAIKPIGDWTAPHLAGSTTIEGQPLFSAVALKGEYAFVTSAYGDGGKGLHVFDYSSGTDPLPVATGFDLGVAAYSAVVSGDVLYVATADPSAEIQMFDVADPSQFSLSKRLASIDLPGSGRARSFAFFGSTLFVGATEDATEPELFAFDVTDPASPQLLSSLQDSTSVFGLSLHDGFAYIAGSMDSMEVRVADAFDPADLSIATGEGYNLTDVHDALSVATVNDDLLIGRRNGDGIEELVLLDLGNGAIPSSPPGPWFQEIGGSVPSLVAEPGGRYAFIATDNIAAQLQVADLAKFRAGQFPVVATATTLTGGGRAVAYDAQHDRVLLATDRGILLYQPGG
ncbi:MAG: hypothetical protein PHX87_00160 [Candidatus Peribacteraceae bacterium]|nr:hypothetical protein [Candidatus Peribacteraceae bacterium]MDD5741821.1 hypothetical protein [Candidatus Peribacteraceae bacterium]